MNTINSFNGIQATQPRSVNSADSELKSGAESARKLPFGPAVIRSQKNTKREDADLYGSNGLRHQSVQGSTDDQSDPANSLSPAEQNVDRGTLAALKKRDHEVQQRAKENGDSEGGTHFIYQKGPDGKQYAIGSVSKVAQKTDDTATDSSQASEQSTGDVDSDVDSNDNDPLLQKLKSRDAEVRSHEQAHVLAGGTQISGNPEYNYQTGPDGRKYAIGGSVNIAVSVDPENPEKSAREAAIAQQSTLAPGAPSGQDMKSFTESSGISARMRQKAMSAYTA